MASNYTGLILLSGMDSPGVTEALFTSLQDFAISILDIEQVVIRGRLILTVLISCDPVHEEAIIADLEKTAADLDLDLAVEFSEIAQKSTFDDEKIHLVLLGAPLKPAPLVAITSTIRRFDGNIEQIHRTADYPITAIEFLISIPDGRAGIVQKALVETAFENEIDISVEKAGLSRRARRLVILDVDSTFIQEEVIELLAKHAGVEEEVRIITESAMRGELDFAESLTKRVELLRGLPISVLDEVRKEITLSRGARTLIRTLHRHGHKVALVSGGFAEVLAPLITDLKIDHHRANHLGIQDGLLTGKVEGKIIDSAGKAQALRDFAAAENLPLSQTIAVGDGANDIDMIEIAGLGIAFNAKPAVKKAANSSVNNPYLDSVLYLMGISRSEVLESDINN